MGLQRTSARRLVLAAAMLMAIAATAVACGLPLPGRDTSPPTRPGTGPTASQGSTEDGLARRPAPEGPRRRSFTVIAAGDILLHESLWRQAARDASAAGGSGYDFHPLFASIQPTVAAADLAVCHLETPLGPAGGPFYGYPLFSVPPQIVPALAKVGYDSCSTASNHSIDRGEAGVARTLDALDQAGIAHTGTARTAKEAARLNLLNVRGVTVAHLSYTFSFNGLVRPAGKQYLANYLRADSVLAEARRARKAGAKVVMVSIHWGTEYQAAPNGHQTSMARRLLASPDVDLILGHHAHVVQPMERIGGEWVAYGMGNQVAGQNFSQPTRDGIMPRFTFTEVRPGVFQVTKAEVLPIHMWLDSHPVRLYEVAAALRSAKVSASVKASCRGSLARTKAVLGLRGAYAAGLILVS